MKTKIKETRVTAIWYMGSNPFTLCSKINEQIDDLEHSGREIVYVKIFPRIFSFQVLIVSTWHKEVSA